MNIGKKTSWQVAAVTAAALLGSVAQAHDWDFDRDDYGEVEHHHHHYDHHHDRYHERYESRYDDRYYDRYQDRYSNRYNGYGYGGYNDYRWREHAGQNRRLRDDHEFWAPPFSPPWLYRHGFLGR